MRHLMLLRVLNRLCATGAYRSDFLKVNAKISRLFLSEYKNIESEALWVQLNHDTSHGGEPKMIENRAKSFKNHVQNDTERGTQLLSS
jgi:hypothetical protein